MGRIPHPVDAMKDLMRRGGHGEMDPTREAEMRAICDEPVKPPVPPQCNHEYHGLLGVVISKGPLPPVVTRWHRFLRFMGWR